MALAGRGLLTVVVACLALAPVRSQAASGYPDRPITIIVPAPVGGASDLLARVIGGTLRRILGQPLVVDNRPGAIGSIGAAAVAHAEPNGYTVLCTPSAPIVLSPLVNKNLPYDAAALEPIIGLAQSFFVVAVRKDFPAESIAELITHAKANPNKINYASGGTGSGSYFATLLFARSAGIEMVNIPYLGSAPAQQALVAGQVDLLIDGIGTLFSIYKAGLVKVLAISATKRIAELPGVPSLAESGLGDTDLSGWYGVFGPPKTPAPIVAKLNQAINDILSDPEIRAGIAALMLRPTGGPQQAFVDFVVRDRQRWKTIVQRIR
jgi:tripartite-type tricarboxylate transporter receptor subunit TctC